MSPDKEKTAYALFLYQVRYSLVYSFRNLAAIQTNVPLKITEKIFFSHLWVFTLNCGIVLLGFAKGSDLNPWGLCPSTPQAFEKA